MLVPTKPGQVPTRSGHQVRCAHCKTVKDAELRLALAATQQNPAPGVPLPGPQNPQAPQTPAPAAAQAPQPTKPALSLVVLDPAHGGPDAGAHGATGVSEAEVVLNLARAVRGQLESQGWHVVQTRQGNENPTFDERSAKINALRGAVFISLHVSSSGPGGTIRAYSLPVPGDTAGTSSLPAPAM